MNEVKQNEIKSKTLSVSVIQEAHTVFNTQEHTQNEEEINKTAMRIANGDKPSSKGSWMWERVCWIQGSGYRVGTQEV